MNLDIILINIIFCAMISSTVSMSKKNKSKKSFLITTFPMLASIIINIFLIFFNMKITIVSFLIPIIIVSFLINLINSIIYRNKKI